MRRSLSLLLLPLLVVGFSISLVSMVSAQSANNELSESQIGRIKSNCVALKGTVNQLHASDGLLRVNRGQMYQSMSSALMERFNDRLGDSKLDNKGMVTVTGNYRTALANFRTDYIKYEQKLSQALRIDCVANPVDFYTTLQEARKLRTVVHEDVKRLHQLIDDYRSSVGGFLVNYERLAD